MSEQLRKNYGARKKEVQPNTEELLGRGLPANVDAERAVLSALLLNDENLTLVSDVLSSNEFYTRAHQYIYKAVLELAQANKKVDIVLLQDLLSSRKQLDDIGGVIYLMELQEDIPAVGLIAHHAKIVKDKAVLRGLISSFS